MLPYNKAHQTLRNAYVLRIAVFTSKQRGTAPFDDNDETSDERIALEALWLDILRLDVENFLCIAGGDRVGLSEICTYRHILNTLYLQTQSHSTSAIAVVHWQCV